MAAQGHAEVTWAGSLATGKGYAEFESGTGGNLSVTCALEDQSPAGKTTPEELLAAAHASCFTMALTQILTMGHHKPEDLRVGVTTTLDQVDGGVYVITREALDIRGKVPGIDTAAFLEAVEAAKPVCAVGLAIKGNVEVTYQARLEQ